LPLIIDLSPVYAPFGLVVLAAGIGYLLMVRRRLGVQVSQAQTEKSRRGLRDLIEGYHLAGREHRL